MSHPAAHLLTRTALPTAPVPPEGPLPLRPGPGLQGWDRGPEADRPDTDESDESAHRRRVRSVFVSDVHLGTPGCQAEALLDFLRAVECDRLYLVGDIIDGWQLRRRWFWPQAHNDVVQKILRKVRKGTHVIFVPGNHDEFARRYVQHSFGGVEVVEDCVHLTADGKRLWVMHGDRFDGVVQHARWLAHLGDHLYDLALELNRHLNSLRARLGLPYWSLSRYLKLKVKRAVAFIDDFERAVMKEARRRGVNGVVCGHIHHAELREVDGLIYANDGDWVESLTALVEHADGRLEILDWSEHLRLRHEAAAAASAVAGVDAVGPSSARHAA